MFSTLPHDSRTLLKTPLNVVTKHIASGLYCHFGITEALTHVVETIYHFLLIALSYLSTWMVFQLHEVLRYQ